MLRRPLAPALPLLFAAACGGTAAPLDWPRLSDEASIDPVLLERIRHVESACSRREPGSWLELAMVYDANDLNGLAARTYGTCLALPPEEAGASQAMLH